MIFPNIANYASCGSTKYVDHLPPTVHPSNLLTHLARRAVADGRTKLDFGRNQTEVLGFYAACVSKFRASVHLRSVPMWIIILTRSVVLWTASHARRARFSKPKCGGDCVPITARVFNRRIRSSVLVIEWIYPSSLTLRHSLPEYLYDLQ